jgi:hypothetical protein
MDAAQFEATLLNVEVRLRRLRTLYDQYFQGLERVEPHIERTEVERLIDQLRKSQPRNTALRFRFNQVVQRMTTYNTYWQRTRRQIEEGTFKRDVLRARRRFGGGRTRREGGLDITIDVEPTLDSLPFEEAPPEPEPPAPPAPETPATLAVPPLPATVAGTAGGGLRAPTRLSIPPRTVPGPLGGPASAGASLRVSLPPPPLGASGEAAARATHAAAPVSVDPHAIPKPARRPSAASKQPPGPSASAPRPPPTGAAATGPSEDQIQALYQRYLDARRKNQERTDNVKVESIAKTVRDMLPKLEQKHAGKRIDFEVVLKDGRVALKPVAK